MLQRINSHIVNYLPTTLETELRVYEERIDRNNFLTNEQRTFIQVFLSQHQYFYLPNNNFFYEYTGTSFFIVKEDDIIHKVLSRISNCRVLMQWKYKTKLNVIKQIRERSLFECIPETTTIQNVLNALYPSVFTSKNSTKYFLTILGDNILKKNQHLIFLVSPQMKKIITDIDNIAFGSIGVTNATHNFMTKYHENHSYEHCRLLKMNESFPHEVWREILKKIGLDLICVAVHYSNRYGNSDIFIETKSDEELSQYSLFLKQHSAEVIVSEFCDKYIIRSSPIATATATSLSNVTAVSGETFQMEMEWKNLHFLWKQFLSVCNLPNIIYASTLKNIFKQAFVFFEERDSFCGITSKYLPLQRDFIAFWESTVDVGSVVNELEIDEICSLFKLWSQQEQHQRQLFSNGNISEETVLKILIHFFPTIEIMEDKNVLNVSCSLWNKTKDIKNSFEFIKYTIKFDNTALLVSIDDMYHCYSKYCNTGIYGHKLVVSKRYFENFLHFELSEFVVYDKFIETRWFVS